MPRQINSSVIPILTTYNGSVFFVLVGLHDERLTITIDVDGTRITLAVVVGVGLFWITVVWTIIASVTNLIGGRGRTVLG